MAGNEIDPPHTDENPSPESLPGEAIFASEPPFSPGSRKPAAYAAVVIGLLAMVAGAVFFVRSVGSTKGSSSPQAAVQRLLDAASNEDVLGVLETLPANERNLFATRLQTLTKELGRLGILRSDVNLSDLQGIDLEFTGVTMRSETLKEGLAAVEILEGRSTYRVDPATTPLGDFVRKLLPRSAFSTVSGSDELADDDIVLATVREGDDWYVSLFYTIAEATRRDANVSFPAAGYGVVARGAASPEKAVEELIRAGLGLDLRRVIELLPPDEAAALHDYASLFLTNVESIAREAREHFRAQIRELSLSAKPDGDDHLVTVKRFSFKVDGPDFGSIDYDGECLTMSGGFFGFDGPQRQCGTGLEGVAPLPGPALSDAGFTVVERDGLFYVSPIRTIFDSVIAALKALSPDALETINDFFSSMFGFAEGGESFPPAAFETLAPKA